MSADQRLPSADPSPTAILIEIDGSPRRLELSQKSDNGVWIAALDGVPLEIDAQLVQPGILSLIVQGRAYRCVLDEGPIETAIQIGSQRYLLTIDDPRSLTSRRRKANSSGGLQVIKAPMPGKIVRLLLGPGDPVAANQGIVVIEAMKMQNELKATRAGKILEVQTEAGATVIAGAVLVVIE
jgi:biotin carboxyl carrier protein